MIRSSKDKNKNRYFEVHGRGLNPMKWRIKSGFDMFLISEIRVALHSTEEAETLTMGRTPRMKKAAEMFKLADNDAALYIMLCEMNRVLKQGT